MSKFLGPIHLWLHNKILRQEHLEVQWEEQLKSLGSEQLNDLLLKVDEQYGEPKPYESLENSIDTSNIHGWLQERIRIAETRFAAKLTYSEAFGPVGYDTAISVFKSAGEESAREVQMSGAYDGNLATAYKLLNNYVLEGMPCDHAGAILTSETDTFEWINQKCLHEKYWLPVSGNVENHYTMRDAFSQAFFSTLDQINYQRTRQEEGTSYSLNR